MTLNRQLVMTSVFVALPIALLMSAIVSQARERDRRLALLRVGEGHLTDVVRDGCEADPVWFLAGPRTGRPSAAQRAMPDADLYLPRPDASELPFEVFAYYGNFEAGSSAAPRFPEEVRRQLRGLDRGVAFGAYDSETGEGLQMGLLTGWSPGPCAVLLFRLRPEPDARLVSFLLFTAFFVGALVVAGGVTTRTWMRVRTLARAVRASASEEYATMVPVGGRDEISAIAATFNEAAADIRRRAVDVRDREEALRRHVRQTREEVATPLSDLEGRLGGLANDAVLSDRQRGDLRQALVDAHALSARLNNLIAVVRLRATAGEVNREPVDISRLVERVAEARAPLASATGVDVAVSLPTEAVMWNADAALLERAIANVVDNAIVYNRPGGKVTIDLVSYERDGQFTLRVADDGSGVTDETFAALTANRRFRGDEGRSGRAGRGLGLAVSREVADRFGLQLELRRPSTGGLEVEFTVR